MIMTLKEVLQTNSRNRHCHTETFTYNTLNRPTLNFGGKSLLRHFPEYILTEYRIGVQILRIQKDSSNKTNFL